jgi:hypothetical protein
MREPVGWSRPLRGFSLELETPDRERSSVRLIVVLEAWLTLSKMEVRDEQADEAIGDEGLGV